MTIFLGFFYVKRVDFFFQFFPDFSIPNFSREISRSPISRFPISRREMCISKCEQNVFHNTIRTTWKCWPHFIKKNGQLFLQRMIQTIWKLKMMSTFQKKKMLLIVSVLSNWARNELLSSLYQLLLSFWKFTSPKLKYSNL